MPGVRLKLAGLLLLGASLLGGRAMAQNAPPTEIILQADQLQFSLTPEMQKAVETYLGEREAKAKLETERKQAEALVTKTTIPLAAVWDNGLWFRTPDKAWNLHVGGRLQTESVWWVQPLNLRGPPPGNGGIPASNPGDGVGTLEDGTFFRRVRLRADGTAYGQLEYVAEVNFDSLNFITFEGMWVGLKDLPWLGTVRVGQHKVPQGLESASSSFQLNLLERSAVANAFWILFAPGIYVANDYFNQRATSQVMLHRVQPLGVPSDFGNGDYAATARMTGLPIYEDDGERLLHLGFSYQWRRADLGSTIQPGGTGSDYGNSQNVLRYRARPELRDFVGIPNLAGDPANFIDTGYLIADFAQTLCPELLVIHGPFSLQAESAFSYARNAQFIYGPGVGSPPVNPFYWGSYAEVGWFLTGEHRNYNTRFGTDDRLRVGDNFRYNRCGGLQGCGAWQLAYRFSYVDLNDRGINGGQLSQHTCGVNWYLNDCLKVQFQYSNIARDVPLPAVSGTVHSFGTSVQLIF